jgi:hypothetical protein
VERPSAPDPEDNRGEAGYMFDDPLGKNTGLGMELGKLGQYDPDQENSEEDDDDVSDASSSDEEPEASPGETEDVPVMNLFAGNFHYEDSDAPAPPTDEFANFDANFDDAFAAAAAADTNRSSNESNPTSEAMGTDSSTMDDVFATGDHSQLLETEDDFLGTSETTDVANTTDGFDPFDAAAVEAYDAAAVEAGLPAATDGFGPLETATGDDDDDDFGPFESAASDDAGNDVEDKPPGETSNSTEQKPASKNDGDPFPDDFMDIVAAPSDEINADKVKASEVENGER